MRCRRAVLESEGVLWGALIGSGGPAMEALSALLESVSRLLVAGFGAAPLAWVVGALLLLIMLVVLIARRPRPVAQNDVQRAYLASAAATRKDREIGEI